MRATQKDSLYRWQHLPLALCEYIIMIWKGHFTDFTHTYQFTSHREYYISFFCGSGGGGLCQSQHGTWKMWVFTRQGGCDSLNPYPELKSGSAFAALIFTILFFICLLQVFLTLWRCNTTLLECPFKYIFWWYGNWWRTGSKIKCFDLLTSEM